MKYKLYHHHHRLDYIAECKYSLNNFEYCGKSLHDKTAMIANENNVIIVEYTDGQSVGQEDVSFVKNILEYTKYFFDNPKQKIFYVRPACSITAQIDIKNYLKSQNVIFFNCLPWPYTKENYQNLLSHRFELRKEGKRRLDLPAFIGNTRHNEIHSLRRQKLENFYDTYKKQICIFEDSRKADYLRVMLTHRVLLQPNGVSVRHNLYEGFLLGTPSIVEKTSYLGNIPDNVYIEDDFCVKTQQEYRVKKLLSDNLYFTEIRSNAIDFFERNMLPDQIIKSIMDFVESHE
jgi:hypothetical protein